MSNAEALNSLGGIHYGVDCSSSGSYLGFVRPSNIRLSSPQVRAHEHPAESHVPWGSDASTTTALPSGGSPAPAEQNASEVSSVQHVAPSDPELDPIEAAFGKDSLFGNDSTSSDRRRLPVNWRSSLFSEDYHTKRQRQKQVRFTKPVVRHSST